MYKLKIGTEQVEIPKFIANELTGKDVARFDVFINQLLSAYYKEIKAGIIEKIDDSEMGIPIIVRLRSCED
jgi:hypothetical protein